MEEPSKKRIDIIVPVRNAAATAGWFVQEVNRLPIPERVRIGFIFVEDSSTDATLEKLRELASASRDVSFYSLAKGYGEGPAVVFGMRKSTADAVITMEVGGGHPLHAVPELISHYLDGADIVQAVRRSLKNRPLYRSLGSSVFNVILKLVAGFDVTSQNVYFRLLAKEQKRLLTLNPRSVTSLRFGMPDSKLCRIDTVPFDAEEIAGQSTYGFTRLAKLAVDFVLSVISFARLCLLLLLGIVLAAVAGGLIGITLILCVLAVAVRSWRLWNNRIMDLVVTKEERVAVE